MRVSPCVVYLRQYPSGATCRRVVYFYVYVLPLVANVLSVTGGGEHTQNCINSFVRSPRNATPVLFYLNRKEPLE